VLEDGRLWFTMKEVSGRTLSAVIQTVHTDCGHSEPSTRPRWTLWRLVEALRRVCEAVAYAHSRGVLHRDLKPENIMVGGHGEVLVLDWGLAKLLDQTDDVPLAEEPAPIQTNRSLKDSHRTLRGQVAGTPAYMPPEQARGAVESIDTRSDVYSLGSILYEMLHGQAPYIGKDAEAILAQVLSPTPDALADDGSSPQASAHSALSPLDHPKRPPALVAICRRAMAHDPAERFQTVETLASELADWLNGTKRRSEALAVVEQAEARASVAMDLRARAAVQQAEATVLLRDVASWQSEEDKAVGWAQEDDAALLNRQAEQAELEEELLLHASLTHVADLPEAHSRLAARYQATHQATETRREDTIRAEAQLRQHLAALPEAHPARPGHAAYLKGTGAFSLVTDPPGAEVFLHRYVQHNRRLVPQFERSLGRTPLRAVPLPMGSYLCILRHPEHAEVRYPFSIERQHHWSGVPPGSSAPEPVHLPRRGDLGAEDCYIPPGWFWSGGDQDAPNSLPKRRLWADAFIIRRFPVTNTQYLVFLNSLVTMGRVEEALQHAPRERAGTVDVQGALIVGFDGQHFSLRPDSDGDNWELDSPVLMVDWYGAAAFAAWEAARTGMKWSLPRELGWEKAARGVDGRCFPWGDHFDPSRACMRESHPGRMLPMSVHSYPLDQSPYGVRGMAGGATDWCADRLRDGPMLKGARIQTTWDGLEAESLVRVTRGGCWYSERDHLRVADRYWNQPSSRAVSLGFRLACRVP
jgi:eukaryotic-like serine/threonine-protein kinase